MTSAHREPTFVARPPASDLLRRRRPVEADAHVRFVGLPGELSVYLRRSTAKGLLRLARAAAPRETVGLLAGRALEDGEGRYVLVEEVEVAGPGEHRGSPGVVAFTGRGGQALRDRLVARCPALEIVGWWHSHPHGPAAYSHEDRIEQSTWSAPHHVGIIVSCNASEPFGVYAGPDAVALRRRDPLADRADGASGATPAQHQARSATPVPYAPRRAVRQTPAQPPPRPVNANAGASRLSRLGHWLMIVAAATLLVSAVLTSRAADRVESETDRLVAAPRQPRERTRPATAVRLEALRCRAGSATAISVSPTRAKADPDPSILEPSIATAQVSGERLKITCLAPGRTVLTISRSAAGGLALAQLPIVVDPRPEP